MIVLSIVDHRCIHHDSAFQVNEFLFSLSEVSANIGASAYLEAEAKKHARESYAAGGLKTWFARFDKQIGENGAGFIVGGSLTAADLQFWSFTRSLKQGGVIDYISTEYIDQFPHISAHLAKIEALPAVADYFVHQKSRAQ